MIMSIKHQIITIMGNIKEITLKIEHITFLMT